MASGDDKTTPESLGEVAGFARALAFWDGGAASYLLAPGAVVLIGRSVDCRLRIDHGSVSRVHARLVGGAPATIEDLGSSNGTRVRGVRIADNLPMPIGRGDVIEVGSVLVVLQGGGDEAPRAPVAIAEPEAASPPPIERLVELVAQSALSALLLGETGVGKGVTAAALHAKSPRAARSFVRVDCAALPENLLEAELFGYERGAFTGAVQAKPGLLEVADGGTLFLDEVAEAPLATQAKLLGCLESHAVQRLGSLRPRPVDVRFVAATNRDLDAAVRAGTFRRDLFYRLAGVTIAIPPLRARRREILPLARSFLEEASRKAGRPVPQLSEACSATLLAHLWPGNIRELRAAVERAVVFAAPGEPLRPQHLGLEPATPPVEASARAAPNAREREHGSTEPSDARLRDEVEALERARIEEALARCQGNQTRAAKLLGMSRRSLIGRLEAYALPRPRKR